MYLPTRTSETSGRSIKGTCALTEFEVEAAPADAPTQAAKIKIAKATADIALPETPLEAIYYDKTDKRRVTGPIDFAIDGKPDSLVLTPDQGCAISRTTRCLTPVRRGSPISRSRQRCRGRIWPESCRSLRRRPPGRIRCSPSRREPRAC